MKPWGEVSSVRDANTVFEGQQINEHTERREEKIREDTQRETQKRDRREITEQITEEVNGPL
jgi:DNA recombination-dependent growth factor C